MSDKAQRFVDHLKTLDRGPLATLRRSLAFEPGTYVPAFPFVEPFANTDGWPRTVYYLVAGLFALHPDDISGDSLGRTIAALYRRRESQSIESRFIVLLDADPEQLPQRMRQTITLVKDHGLPVNWTQLIDDLMGWSHESRHVQRNWARDFYRGIETEGMVHTNQGG